MAHLLVAAADSIPGDAVASPLLSALRADGHQAERLTDPLAARDADGLIAVMDGADGQTHAAWAIAAAADKPALALVRPEGEAVPVRTESCMVREGDDLDAWVAALPDFYERVRPFAGRLVRDLIPQLVKEAGHNVTFRAVDAEQRPLFLKQKIIAEASELLQAAAGAEKEEIADLLEALEALIRARDYDRDALKQVKAAKHKRRGGFERGWVVEETATATAHADPAIADDEAQAEPEDARKEAPAASPGPQFFEV